jgi:HK97 family phage major capsid protein
MSNIKALRQRKADITKKQRALLDKAAVETRDLTEPEGAEFQTNLDQMKSIEASLEREEKVLEFERSVSPVVDDPNEQAAANAGAPTPTGKPGFKTFGEFLVSVVRAERTGGRAIDQRLIQAVASGASETVPSDGGFLVQKDFSAELIQRVYESGQIASRVRRIPISSNANGIKINAIAETSRVDGSRWGGILAYWVNEADTLTATKPKYRQIELNLQKLIGLCYATDELLQDAAALEAVIMQAFPEEFTFRVEDAIFNGTGAGQPEGILNSAATIQVAKASTDPSGPGISTTDVLDMWQHMWGRSRPNAAWFINQDVEAALYPLTLGSGTAVVLLYTPPGLNGNSSGFGQLLGRPVIPVEHCSTLGTPGDIILADLSQYLMIDKGAPQAASSIHVRFLNDETTFRFVYRVDGQSAWNLPLTPKNGSNLLSPFITLATRS